MAVEKGNTEIVKILLSRPEIDLNAKKIQKQLCLCRLQFV